MKTKSILIIIFSLSVLQADQAAWITKKEANTGASYVKEGDRIISYCEPCGDKESIFIEVVEVSVKAVGVERYHQLMVNGEGVDLAYIYVDRNNKWENLAMLCEIPVNNVPQYVPEETIQQELSEFEPELMYFGMQLILNAIVMDIIISEELNRPDELEMLSGFMSKFITYLENREQEVTGILEGKEEFDKVIALYDDMLVAISSYRSYLDYKVPGMLEKANIYKESSLDQISGFGK
jgi:hypothetical protein